jgi:hypothetical protein
MHSFIIDAVGYYQRAVSLNKTQFVSVASNEAQRWRENFLRNKWLHMKEEMA